MAFCAWLEFQLRERGALPTGSEVRLPTEHEWERAARGTDGREYPWGETYESGRANIDETFDKVGPFYLRSTSAVGIYPDASPDGVRDLSGNVFEWCATSDDLKDQAEHVRRVVRGGSWLNLRHLARASVRDDDHPVGRLNNVGFRVVCVSPIRKR